jgi:hypothetical protein
MDDDDGEDDEELGDQLQEKTVDLEVPSGQLQFNLASERHRRAEADIAFQTQMGLNLKESLLTGPELQRPRRKLQRPTPLESPVSLREHARTLRR